LAFDEAVVEQLAPAEEEPVAAAAGMDLIGMVRTAGVVIVVLLVIFLAWTSLRKARVPRQAVGSIDLRELEAAAGGDGEISLAGAGLGTARAGSPSAALAAASGDPLSDMTEMIDRQPEEVAHLLRSWLGDRRGIRR
jgi:flagellar M-ring protein FliF